MAIVKIVEISASSPDSFDDATARGIRRACETLEDVKGAWVKEMKVVVEAGKVTEYRVDLKVSFLLKGSE